MVFSLLMVISPSEIHHRFCAGRGMGSSLLPFLYKAVCREDMERGLEKGERRLDNRK
jgi:hypothetical protein